MDRASTSTATTTAPTTARRATRRCSARTRSSSPGSGWPSFWEPITPRRRRPDHRPQPRDGAGRGALPPLRLPPGPRVPRRSRADGRALLHELAGPRARAGGRARGRDDRSGNPGEAGGDLHLDAARTRLALAIVVVALLALAGPAAAHASLESSDPPSGAVLAQSPTQISLRFGEAVEIALGAIRLYDGTRPRARRRRRPPPRRRRHARSPCPPHGLDDGAYVVSWRVVSADSHPVNGAFTFQVGTGDAVSDPGLVTRLLSQDGGNPAAGAVLGVGPVRVLRRAGRASPAAWCSSSRSGRPGRRRRRIRVLLWIALGAGVVAGAVAIAVQAPYASGRALSDALKPSEWSEVLRTRSGRAWGLRVAAARRRRRRAAAHARAAARTRWWQLVGIFAGARPVRAGGRRRSRHHRPLGRRRAGSPPSPTSAACPSGSAASPCSLVGVLREPDPGDALDRTRRFSPIAFGAVAVIIASGVVQAYRQVGIARRAARHRVRPAAAGEDGRRRGARGRRLVVAPPDPAGAAAGATPALAVVAPPSSTTQCAARPPTAAAQACAGACG